jgi:hypothetical protein
MSFFAVQCGTWNSSHLALSLDVSRDERDSLKLLVPTQKHSGRCSGHQEVEELPRSVRTPRADFPEGAETTFCKTPEV